MKRLLAPFALAALALAGCSSGELPQKAGTVTVAVTGNTPVVIAIGNKVDVTVKRGSEQDEEFDSSRQRIYRPSPSAPATTSSTHFPLVIPWCSWNDTPMPGSGQDTCDDVDTNTTSPTARS